MFHYILVVDDDPETRRVLADVLIEAGYSVREAAHGEDALGLIAQHLPDIVFLDLDMPVMDGWTFAATLLTRGVVVPLVVMASDGTAHRAARQLHAVGYLSKPPEEHAILDVLRQPKYLRWVA